MQSSKHSYCLLYYYSSNFHPNDINVLHYLSVMLHYWNLILKIIEVYPQYYHIYFVFILLVLNFQVYFISLAVFSINVRENRTNR